ncbi:CYTH domain-containing protein [Longispora albida]|uniref:CYTH domain-containing protein n=1 Tax=Longispora albida TaxID=203523 RepID=UPI000368F009|nr:CYTH domain-containing protein [Longispora albida]
MPVEIEFRARLTAAEREVLEGRLRVEALDLGQDDKEIVFYVLPDKLLKVVRNLTAQTAMVVVKTSRIGEGAAFPEIELPIADADIPAAVAVFDALGYAQLRHTAVTERHNYRFDGVDLAVKWSRDWGHHVELEIVLPDTAGPEDQLEAERQIGAVADHLGVTVMTEEELRQFTRRFEAAATHP